MARQKSLLKKTADGIKAFYNAVDDRVVQLTRGKHVKYLAEMMERVEALPGGKDLLALAQQHGVEIAVVAPRDIDKAKGRFSRSASRKLIRVANIGDVALMTTTLWHELRHVQQHIERGDIPGKTTRLLDTRIQHTIALMHEADAFTQQALMALRQDKDGKPEYLKQLVTRQGAAAVTTTRFIAKHPYKNYADEAQFARELFTEVMVAGMAGYNNKYFEAYHDTFKELEDVKSLRKFLAKKSAAPDFNETAALTTVYGEKYVAVTSIRAVAQSFLHAQPQEAYDVLKLIEETSARAKDLGEAEYKTARAEILKRTKSLAKAFNKAALEYPQQARKALREAANANRPMIRDKKRGVSAANS